MEKNLGHATAYGYAKSKGYSGTEDEFAELMADYASVGQSAAQSAEQAAASAQEAYNRVAAAGYMHFAINSIGHLEYIKNNVVDADFSINSDGHLVVGGLT